VFRFATLLAGRRVFLGISQLRYRAPCFVSGVTKYFVDGQSGGPARLLRRDALSLSCHFRNQRFSPGPLSSTPGNRHFSRFCTPSKDCPFTWEITTSLLARTLDHLLREPSIEPFDLHFPLYPVLDLSPPSRLPLANRLYMFSCPTKKPTALSLLTYFKVRPAGLPKRQHFFFFPLPLCPLIWPLVS